MNAEEIISDDNLYLANTYARFDIVIDSGDGALLYDLHGKEYIDCASGIGVNVFGVNDEVWKNAVIGQKIGRAHV